MPDSICPKGWELPRYSNDKSYQKLLVNVYGQQSGASINNGDKGILGIPLSFLRAGSYLNNDGNRINRGSYGYYWESDVLNNLGHLLESYSLALLPQNMNYRGRGYSIRCVSK